MTSVETFKNIMRGVDPDVSEEELDRRATKVAKDSATIDAIEKALDEAKLTSIGMHSGAYDGKFCLHFTDINSIKKWNNLTAVMNKFTDKTKLVKKTMTTMTFALI